MKFFIDISVKFYTRFLKLNIKSKINIFYIVVLIMSISTSYFFYSAYNNREMEYKLSTTATQTLNALDKNLEFILEDVSQFSNLLFSDKNVQDALKSSNPEGLDFDVSNNLTKYIVNMLLSADYIASVYLFDNYDNLYSQGKYGLKPLVVDKIENASWHNDVNNLGGKLKWVINTGGVIQPDPNHNYISLVRIINDMSSYKKLGTLMVNVDVSTIEKEFEDIGDKYKSQFFIIDTEGKYITHPPVVDKGFDKELISQLTKSDSYIVKKIGSQRMLICSISSKHSNWKIVGVMPINELSKQISTKSYAFISLIIINCIFIFIGAIYVSKLVTNPLAKMQIYMKKAEKGDFQTMPEDKIREDEISELKKGFNKMVMEIENLIQTVKKEQKTIRKNELNLIRAQINPHFLYNTLDAISALSMLKDNENTLKITKALGNFYHISLSNGKEVVSIAEEINCIKNYITILDIRYNGKFNVIYEIQEEIYKFNILKLILQPIVENSIHHGIRNKRGKGTIIIKGYRLEDTIIFKIIDDGIGMDIEMVNSIVYGCGTIRKNGFGINSSIQRIAIFYNVENPIEITSQLEVGTEVVIKVPVMKGDQYEIN
ncbi:MAG: histidine kinase [Clostridiaceae bacterium]|nr:histidine kinase [Clostridiaceae bacterium]